MIVVNGIHGMLILLELEFRVCLYYVVVYAEEVGNDVVEYMCRKNEENVLDVLADIEMGIVLAS